MDLGRSITDFKLADPDMHAFAWVDNSRNAEAEAFRRVFKHSGALFFYGQGTDRLSPCYLSLTLRSTYLGIYTCGVVGTDFMLW